MKVFLAGYNVDTISLEHDEAVKSPETISAAFARISRSPKTIKQLRIDAIEDVERARKSNSKIVFDMGHASIAEHAVLNFDIEGISRLALEALESHRLASFTEKSQRYVRFDKDYVIPDDVGDRERFIELSDMLFATYKKLSEELIKYYVDQGVDKKAAKKIAVEDARFILPLATKSQVGMTVNARELEYMIRVFGASRYSEVRLLGRMLVEEAIKIIPSLIRYTRPAKYDHLLHEWQGKRFDYPSEVLQKHKELLEVLDYTQNGELLIIAAMLNRLYGRYLSEKELEDLEGRLDYYMGILELFFNEMGPHDPAPREFEHAKVTFGGVLSASAYAQLKRHRMMSISAGPYDLRLGYTVPPVFEKAGVKDIFIEAIERLNKELSGFDENVRPYFFTNAHRRRVIVTANLRELYHFFRLRMDRHAQWEIRDFAIKLAAEVKRLFPVCGALIAGKDTFESVKQAYFESRANKKDKK